MAHTTIRKRLTGDLMVKLFESNKCIRNFTLVNPKVGDTVDPKKHYYYEILMRHNDNEKASKMFDLFRNIYVENN